MHNMFAFGQRLEMALEEKKEKTFIGSTPEMIIKKWFEFGTFCHDNDQRQIFLRLSWVRHARWVRRWLRRVLSKCHSWPRWTSYLIRTISTKLIQVQTCHDTSHPQMSWAEKNWFAAAVVVALKVAIQIFCLLFDKIDMFNQSSH